ncbi:MAG TPA: peptidylprolyl isomerase [Planctomycetota bacterium]|nr:peptidylprolyl isomerase [Planctomycetota bacterium]
MYAFAVIPFVLLAAPPQDPPDVLATFKLDGRPATVTRNDVAIEMAFHLRRQPRGQQVCETMVDTTLARQAAKKQNLMPTEAEVRAFWDELQRQLRAAGQKPEDFAGVRNTSMAQLYEDLAVQIAQERLVRAELGMRPDERVSGDMQKLWLQEQRKKHKVVTDPDQLPPGSAARIDADDLPIADLGSLLLRTSEDHERDHFVRRTVYLQCIEALARKEGVQLSDMDLDEAVKRRRDDAARDPRYRGIPFEQMLKAQGLTIASLRELRTFRAHVLLDKLAQRRFPTADLLAELGRDRALLLELVGPRRRLGLIFVRALDEANALVPLDFAAATKHLETVRQRLAKEAFATVARIESQDPASKMNGGDAGWHRRRSDKLPEPVLAAAFALASGDCSAPIRGEEGCYLVKVLEVEPMPTDEFLVGELREYRAQELAKKLLEDADLQLATKTAESSR